MHCWHKKVLLEKASPEDKIGDVVVNTDATFKVYQAWRDKLTRPASGPNGLRRPLWFPRPWYPIATEAYYFPWAKHNIEEQQTASEQQPQNNVEAQVSDNTQNIQENNNSQTVGNNTNTTLQ